MAGCGSGVAALLSESMYSISESVLSNSSESGYSSVLQVCLPLFRESDIVLTVRTLYVLVHNTRVIPPKPESIPSETFLEM